MSNSYDTLDDLAVGDRDEASTGGGSGAAIAVLLTLLLGCGLVFAAYKLGQRTGVDDPPLLMADSDPVKVLPAELGGQTIPNTQNASNAMIDQRPPVPGGYAVQDGIVVARGLPARDIEMASTIDVGEFRREEIDLAAIRPATSISGEPALTEGGAPDRALERLRSGGADVIVPVEGGSAPLPGTAEARLPGAASQLPNGQIETTQLDTITGAAQSAGAAVANATSAALGAGAAALGLNAQATTAPQTPLVTAADTALQNGDTQVASLRMPFPRAKPPLAQRPQRPDSAAQNTTNLRPASTGAGQSSAAALPVAVAPAASLVAPTVVPTPTPATASEPRRQAAIIPPQPVGDAQVQLGAESSPEDVRRKWNALRSAHPDLLSRLGLQILPVSVNGGQLFRLRVGPLPDGSSAAQLCDQLQYRGVPCFVPARS